MKPTLLILAAGMGSRYGGLKQVDAVGPSGEAIIDYSIYDAIESGFGKVVFIIREHFAPSFMENFNRKLNGKIKVKYVFQELDKVPKGLAIPEDRKKPWGTGHAVLMAKEVINEPFVVINADDFYGRKAYGLLGDFLISTAGNTELHAMVGYQLKQTLSDFGHVSRGICQHNADNYLEDVVEHTHIQKTEENIIGEVDGKQVIFDGLESVSMNIWGFKPSFFDYLEKYFSDFIRQNINNPAAEFYIPFVANEVIKHQQGVIKVLKSEDHWFGVTYKEDKEFVVEKIKKLIGQGRYPESLWG